MTHKRPIAFGTLAEVRYWIQELVPVLIWILCGEALFAQTPTAITLASSANPAVYGRVVTFTATVTPRTAVGGIVFLSGTDVLGTRQLTGGVASLSTALLPPGGNGITAYYLGNSSFSPSTSQPLAQVVAAVPGIGFAAPVSTVISSCLSAQNPIIGDLNLDGKQDIVLLCSGQASFAVLLGSGDGTFQSPILTTTSRQPVSAAIADFNTDGIPDLVIACQENNGVVAVHRGVGNGTFQTGYSTLISNNAVKPVALAAADFNRDGTTDFAVAYGGSGSVSTFYSKGDGLFFEGFSYSGFIQPITLAAGDLDGDGDPDLVLGNSSGAVNLLRNDRTRFQIVVGFSSNVKFLSLYLADLNGDRQLDLILGGDKATPSATYLGNGNLTFQTTARNFIVAGPATTLALGDFNGDFKIDVAAVGNTTPSAVGVFLGNGDGSFGARIDYAGGRRIPNTIATGDFNGDGRMDLIAVNAGNQTIDLFTALAPAPTVTSVSSSANPSPLGSPVSLSAQVISADPTRGTPTGTVTFVNGANALGTATLDSNGRATLAATNLLPPSNAIRVVYGGDASRAPSQSAVLVQNVSSIAPVRFSNNTITAGSGPSAILVGSLNGDGVSDLAVMNTADSQETISLLQGISLGRFNPVVNFRMQYQSVGLASGDFNNDGRMDLAVANPAGGFPSGGLAIVKLATGPLALGSGLNFNSGAGARAIAVTDLNLDGNADMITADGSGNTVSILLGNGNATFKTVRSIPIGVAPSAVAAGDFNGDGIPDLVTANTADNSITLLIGNGSGGFGTPRKLSAGAGSGPVALAVADLNGDGLADVVTANSANNGAAIFLGSATTGLAARSGVAAGSGPSGVAVGDFNGDGIADLAVANRAANTVSIRFGIGDGTFRQAGPDLPVGTGPAAIALGDFNQDGVIDFATANSGSNDVTVVIGLPRVQSQTALSVAPNPSALSQVVAMNVSVQQPITGGVVALFDGQRPLNAVSLSSANQASLNFNQLPPGVRNIRAVFQGNTTALPSVGAFTQLVNPTPSLPPALAQTVNVGQRIGAVASADFNRDGVPDVVVADPAANSVRLLRGSPQGLVSAGVFPLQQGIFPQAIAVADFNSDGWLDAVTANRDSKNVTVLYGSAAGFSSQQNFPAARSSAGALGVGDFNGDGRADIIVFDGTLPDVNVLLATPSGFAAAITRQFNALGPARAVAIEDFDGDGRADFAVSDPVLSGPTPFFGNGDGTFRQGPTYRVPSGTLVSGDFNGDGLPDLAVGSVQLAVRITVLLNSGGGNFTAQPSVATPGGDPAALLAADLNGDGKLDLLYSRAGSNDLGFYPGNGSGGFGTLVAIPAGQSAIALAAADFNLDGRLDVVTGSATSNGVTLLTARPIP